MPPLMSGVMRLGVPALEEGPRLLVDLPELLEKGLELGRQLLVLLLQSLRDLLRELLLLDQGLELGEGGGSAPR